jgi:iron complex transport system substrate-binding protein
VTSLSWFASVVVLALLGAGGCRARSAAAPALPAGPPRVVSLHDVTTELVVALGATGHLVGVSEPIQVPESVKAGVTHVPRVGGLESILALRPTVVLGMAVVAQRSPELVQFLRARGVEVWLGHPRTLEDVLGLVTEVGALVGGGAPAATLEQRLRRRVAAVGPPRRAPVRVFVYDCCDPAFTAGGSAVLTDLIRRAGGRNVFADLATDWTTVSWEQVMTRRPQLVLVHDYELEGQGGLLQKRKRIAAIRALAGLPVTVMPLGFSLGGLRSLDGLEHLVQALRQMGDEG